MLVYLYTYCLLIEFLPVTPKIHAGILLLLNIICNPYGIVLYVSILYQIITYNSHMYTVYVSISEFH